MEKRVEGRVEGFLQGVWVVYRGSGVDGVFEGEELAAHYVKLDPPFDPPREVVRRTAFISDPERDHPRAWLLADHSPYLLQREDPAEVARKKEQERLRSVGLSKLTRAEAEALGLTKIYNWKKVMHRWSCDVAGAQLVVESVRLRGEATMGRDPYEWWIDSVLPTTRVQAESLEEAKRQAETNWELARYTHAELKTNSVLVEDDSR